jgi:NhaP-type Na+/H+ or K+/H+ antiporter
MTTVLAFAITLLVAVLLSERAHRSVLSISVLFLVSGFLIGDGILNIVTFAPEHPVVAKLAELALFSVLFTDGMRIGVRDLASAWHLPGRALLLGLPLTLLGTALLAHLMTGLPWLEAFLLGAALSPTDPVFAAAVVGREEVPYRLRRLLNVESGLNDGLALPVVVALLSVVMPSEEGVAVGSLLGEVVFGTAVGVAIPWAAIHVERSRFFAAAATYQPLTPFAVGLVVLGVTSLAHANEFLAAFAAGVTVATIGPELRDEFHQFGELLTELLKLAALLVFGALISPQFLTEISPSGYLFAGFVLLFVRPIALGIALVGSQLRWREMAAAAWFGPKGFASVVYGILILKAGLVRGDELFHLLAIVVAGSIIAHSSTDVLIARWFQKAEAESAEPSLLTRG